MAAILSWYGLLVLCAFLMGGRVVTSLRLARELRMRKARAVILLSLLLVVASGVALGLEGGHFATLRWLWLLIATLVSFGALLITCFWIEGIDRRFSRGRSR